MSALYDFLQKNQIERRPALPLVHSTEAYYIKRFMKSGAIAATNCKFFNGEKLSYFFLGRPAFKRFTHTKPEYWELPLCVIMDFSAFKPKRVYPFDSGAFKSNLYPNFIDMMDLENFEIAADPHGSEKIIGTFFANNRSYYHLKPRPASQFETQFDVEILEEEIKALHKLISFKQDKLDDRRFAIEMQSSHDVVLNRDQVLAVILPESYIESQPVVEYIERHLKASMITYPLFPLKKEFYYYTIYEKVETFFRQKGLFRV
jgi:hypothetical protein